jgi:hypothetical protein
MTEIAEGIGKSNKALVSIEGEEGVLGNLNPQDGASTLN